MCCVNETIAAVWLRRCAELAETPLARVGQPAALARRGDALPAGLGAPRFTCGRRSDATRAERAARRRDRRERGAVGRRGEAPRPRSPRARLSRALGHANGRCTRRRHDRATRIRARRRQLKSPRRRSSRVVAISAAAFAIVFNVSRGSSSSSPSRPRSLATSSAACVADWPRFA